MSGLLALMVSLAAIALVACEAPSRITVDARGADTGSVKVAASIGFDGGRCRDDIGDRFHFVDTGAGVWLGAEVTSASECGSLFCGLCFESEVVIEATYESHDQSAPGSGTLTACLRVRDHGPGAMDHAFVTVESGPFAGYSMDGPVRGSGQDRGCREVL